MSEAEITRLLEAIALVRDRLRDLAEIIDQDRSYDAAGFLRATARRCQQALDGGSFHDTPDTTEADVALKSRAMAEVPK